MNTESLPVLADQPVDRELAVVHAAARSRALLLGRAAGRDSLGRELSARARGRRVHGSGCGATGRRRLRGEHRRRHRRIARDQLRARPLDRQLALGAGADCRVGDLGAHAARADLRSRHAAGSRDAKGWNLAGTALLAGAMVVAGLLARSVHELPGILVAYGRYAATRLNQADIIYKGEGLNASVAVSQLSNGVLNYHNAGKVQASSEPQDMRLQRMLGHLTTLIPPNPRNVLVIGCGAGVTAGAVSIDPARRARNDRRNRAAGAEGGLHLFRRAQLRRGPQPQGPRPHRRCAEFSADDEREVRCGDVGSAGPVGEGRGDALYEGVLRRGEGAI